jgi:hypothetical protein
MKSRDDEDGQGALHERHGIDGFGSTGEWDGTAS